jgi:hypothetical protein
MPKASSLDQYKIPAFKRKRGLAAKARRKRAPVTALEKRIAGIPVVKQRRKVARGRSVATSLSRGRRNIAGSGDLYGAERMSVVEREVSYGGSQSVFENSGVSYNGSYGGSLQGGFSSPLVGDGSSGTSESSMNYGGASYVNDESSWGAAKSSDELLAFRQMRPCGKIEGYIDKIEVAIVTVTSSIRKGDRLVFEAMDGGLFEQTLESMQINREDVVTAYNGDDVGIKVLAEPRKGGLVYRVSE